MQLAKESRSDFLVGLRWQMWQGLSMAAELVLDGWLGLTSRAICGRTFGVRADAVAMSARDDPRTGCEWLRIMVLCIS